MIAARAVRQVLAGEGPGDVPRPAVAFAAQILISLAVTTANAVGAVIVVALLLVALPTPEEASDDLFDALVLGGSGVYLGLALAVGTVRGLRLAAPVVATFKSGEPPDEEQRRAVLRLPVGLTRMQAGLWAGGAVVFGGLCLTQSVLLGIEVALTVMLGGIATSAISYLLVQRLLRGAVHTALTDAPPRRREVPGVGMRVVVAWLLTTAVPVAGALTVAVFALAVDVSATELAIATIALCGVALGVGLLAMVVLARSLSDALRRLRDAFADVESGDLETEVPVFDATEVGYAAAGFNRMLGGLRERERLHDLFGRQVGADVARRALEEGVTLGGEEREAAVLFVDLIGSTSFAADRPPAEVVDMLNGFFATVVGVTLDHGGLVNKFAGDAALCVFGAPLAREDPAGSALAAAREMSERLRDGELDAGIGVSAGTVVAGNVGTADRYEYTVIGDPVNEAARLTELAKDRDGRLLASDAAVERAAAEEAARWELGEAVELRGRAKQTRLAEVRA